MPKLQLQFSFNKYIVLFICAVYLLGPLQKHIIGVLHTFSHVMAHTSYDHNVNHELELAHTHEHKLVSLFSKLFSSEENPNEKDFFVHYSVDKHVVQKCTSIYFNRKITTKHSYFYGFNDASMVKSIHSPPPEILFS